jgi:hypothetical protein
VDMFGVIGLVIFLACLFIAGKLLNSFQNARFTRAWTPLVTAIQGTVVNDGGGAAASWLAGTYRGKPVQAEMVPGRSVYSESGVKFNYFSVTLRDLAGKQDWSVAYKTPLFGMAKTGWQIRAEDKALEARLDQSGIVGAVARFGDPRSLIPFGGPTVAYKVRGRTLLYAEDVTPRWAPTPERFQQQLELLLVLAKVNEEVNKPEPPSPSRDS